MHKLAKSAGPKSGKSETKTPKEEAPLGKSESVQKAIQACEQLLAAGKMKATVAEYVRLLELQKQIDWDEVKEIKVTWVEPGETESSPEK